MIYKFLLDFIMAHCLKCNSKLTSLSSFISFYAFLYSIYPVISIFQNKDNIEEEPKRNYRLEDFLWSGSGEGSGEIWQTTTIIKTTTVLVTQVYGTAICEDCSPSPTVNPTTDQYTHIQPTPTSSWPSETGSIIPDYRYWLVTVLKTNKPVQQSSRVVFEQRLAEMYSLAFQRQQELHLKLNGGNNTSVKRETSKQVISVRVHHMNRKNDNNLELLYTVKLQDRTVEAIAAAEDMKLVSDEEFENMIGYPVLTKAEPYLKLKTALEVTEVKETWLLFAAAASALFLILILIILFAISLINKSKSKKMQNNSTIDSITPGMPVVKQTFEDKTKENLSENSSKKIDKSVEIRQSEVPETKIPPQPVPRKSALAQKLSSPNSYLSMPSVRAFPRGSSIPGPLEKVLEPDISRNAVLSRHSSDTGDPGVVGPLVWDLHRHRVNKQELEVNDEPNISSMRRRFQDLIDDAFSLFGSQNNTPEHEVNAQALQRSGRSKSVVNLSNKDLTSETILRPKTGDVSYGSNKNKVPLRRGAWETSSQSSDQRGTLRPLSAGPFHKPNIDPAWILTDTNLSPTDPAIPLIEAIKNELDKFPTRFSESNY